MLLGCTMNVAPCAKSTCAITKNATKKKRDLNLDSTRAHAQGLTRVRLFATLWIVARQASLSIFQDFPGKSTGVGCHFLLQGIFLILGSNPCLLRLLHWKADSLSLSHLQSTILPKMKEGIIQVSINTNT